MLIITIPDPGTASALQHASVLLGLPQEDTWQSDLNRFFLDIFFLFTLDKVRHPPHVQGWIIPEEFCFYHHYHHIARCIKDNSTKLDESLEIFQTTLETHFLSNVASIWIEIGNIENNIIWFGPGRVWLQPFSCFRSRRTTGCGTGGFWILISIDFFTWHR